VVMTISFLLVKYIEMGLLSCMTSVYLVLKVIAKLFVKVLSYFVFPSAVYEIFYLL